MEIAAEIQPPPAATAPEPARARARSPYVGLSYYTEDFAEVFFGRDSERTLIIGNLRAARLTILYAPSGVGKSSLLRAGVAARLRELARRGVSERGSAKFIPVVFSSWRDDPTEELIGELERAVRPFASDAAIELPRTRLDTAIEAAAAETGATLLVILDQFEEYLLYGPGQTRATSFTDELASAVNRRELPANFLIAVREDAYAAIGDLLRGKVPNPYGNNFSLDYLDRAAAREAIVKPVESFNADHPGEQPIEVEPALVDAVLSQVRTGQVAFGHEGTGTLAVRDGASPAQQRIETPYLQLVLSALWERERANGSHALRQVTLEELGGAQAIVRSHLDRAMSGLSDPERETAADVFNQLVTPSGTKIVHTVSDLAQYAGRELSQVQGLIEKLSSGDQRILRPIPPAVGETVPRVEIFHDVLAPAILAWRSAQSAARLEHEREQAEDRANQQRRRARTFRALAGVAFSLLLVAIVAVILARIETGKAHRAEHVALSRQLAEQALTDLQSGALARGVLLSMEGYRYAQNADTRLGLVRSLEATGKMVAYLGGHSAYVTSVAYSPDGTLIASGSGDGTVLIQDIASGRTVRVLHGYNAFVYGVAFGRSGQLASAGSHGTVVLWSLASGRPLRVMRAPGQVYTVAFNPSGTVLATAGTSGRISLWDAASGRAIRTLGGRTAVNQVAFSRDGRTLASATGREVILWNALNGTRERTLRGHTDTVNGVAFDPLGDTVASASDDRAVILWSTSTGRRRLTLHGHTSSVNSVAFGPDGALLASAGADHNVILWSARSGRQLQTLRGHTATIEDVAFSPSGESLASGADDDQVIVWKARPSLLQRVLSAGSSVLGVAYSPNGRLLASAQQDGTVTVWNTDTGRRIHILRGNSGPVESVAFNHDNRTLAAADASDTVILWNAISGARERTLRGHTDSVYDVAFSPDGRLLASASADQTVILWNAQTGARERTLSGDTDVIYGIAFSPDSRTIASASADKSVRIWDVASGRRLRTLDGHTAAVESVAFSPDGRTLASASNDSTVILWDPRTGRRLGDPLRGHVGAVLSVAFSSDGTTLASAGRDQSVIVWDASTRLGDPLYGATGAIEGIAFRPGAPFLSLASVDQTVLVRGPLPSAVTPAAVFARLCSVVKRNLLASERKEFLPGEQYEKTCPGAP